MLKTKGLEGVVATTSSVSSIIDDVLTYRGFNVDDLANYDACYVPPASPVWEPINIAASQTAKLLV